MARKEYTETDKTEFIAVAQETGIGPAMRELGYPGSHHTAKKWFIEKGLEMPTVSYLQSHAASLGIWYKDAEELAALQMLMDRYVEAMQAKNLGPEELNKLANGYQKVIQTKRLIEGKPTNVSATEQRDGTDLEIARLVSDMESKNNEQVSEL